MKLDATFAELLYEVSFAALVSSAAQRGMLFWGVPNFDLMVSENCAKFKNLRSIKV